VFMMSLGSGSKLARMAMNSGYVSVRMCYGRSSVCI